MRKLRVWVLLLGLSWPVEAQAPLTILTTAYPPYQYEEAGQLRGFSAELVSQLLKSADLTGAIQILPWSRAEYQLKNTPALFFNLSRTPERENTYQWVADIAPIRVFLWKKRQAVGFHGTSPETLSQVSIGGLRNEVSMLYLTRLGLPSVTFEYGNTDEQLVQMLVAKRFDLLPLDELVFLSLVDKLGLNRQDFERFLPLKPTSGRAWLVANLAVPAGVVERLRQAWAELKSNGSYDRLLAKYLKF